MMDQIYLNGVKATITIDRTFTIQSSTANTNTKYEDRQEIYIHGHRELIEQGVDEKGRKFYKINYNQKT